jgi:hypothetical protein
MEFQSDQAKAFFRYLGPNVECNLFQDWGTVLLKSSEALLYRSNLGQGY